MALDEGKKLAIKTSKIELQKRIRIVQEWILQDYVTTDIITECVKKWDITDRQAYRYLWAANRFFEERDKLTAERKKAYYIARKKKLLRDMNPEEKKTAAGVAAVNRVLDSMAKLDGLTPETLKVVGDPERPIKTITEAKITSTHIDYSKLPTEFLEFFVRSRRAG